VILNQSLSAENMKNIPDFPVSDKKTRDYILILLPTIYIDHVTDKKDTYPAGQKRR